MYFKDKFFSRCIVALLVSILFITAFPFGILAVENESSISDIIGETVGYYRTNGSTLSSWWELVALKGAGEDLNDGTWTLPEWNSDSLSIDAQAIHFTGYILGFLSLGIDPSSVWNADERDLIEELKAKQNETTGSFGGVNTHIWAMIALDGAEAEFEWEKAVACLISQQLENGSWDWTEFGSDTGDIDMTGMALQALSPYKNQGEVLLSIDKALAYLKGEQLETGGFSSWGVDNANSLAAVISGLISVGEHVFSEDWIKNGNTVLDALLRFQKEDKSFSWNLEGISDATEQVLIALGDMLNGESIWLRLGNGEISTPNQYTLTIEKYGEGTTTPEAGTHLYESGSEVNLSAEAAVNWEFVKWVINGVEINSSLTTIVMEQAKTAKVYFKDLSDSGGTVESSKSITLSVEGDSIKGTILSSRSVDIQEGDTVYSVLAEALPGKVLSTGSGQNRYVYSIDGLSEFDRGPLSGWTYSVNGWFPGYSSAAYYLSDGDVVRWLYTLNTGKDLNISDTTSSGSTETLEIEEDLDPLSVIPIDVSTEIEKAANWILSQKDNLSDWGVFALSRGGKRIPINYAEKIRKFLQSENGQLRKITDYETIALTVKAVGGDPVNIGGCNLIEKIVNSDKMTMQGINGPIFALLTLDSGNYTLSQNAKWTREKLISFILKHQNTDGGFSLTEGEDSEVDITAMVLQGFANYQFDPEVKEALEKALLWLSIIQLENGGYKTREGENCESAAQVLIGLTSLGISPAEHRFTKEKGNLLSNLLQYQNPDGGFAHLMGEISNGIATEQALMALVSYDRFTNGKEKLFHLTEALPFTDEAEISNWALDYVKKSSKYDLMKGVSATERVFAPKKWMTRAEFAALLINLMGEKPLTISKDGFKDVELGSWYYGYVMKAKEKGFVQGVTSKLFNPEHEISRQEMAIMVSKAFNINMQRQTSTIKDLDQVYPGAASYIQGVYEENIMVGDGEYFYPLNFVTREMAAVIAVKLYERQVKP
jgi:hypothetical protein